ncbi:MAG: D-alanyl-D-alanine carboxypeptidase family protein [Ruminococcus sp.]|nr:D-alanyl-D-alanine carboxypeptidase family protein [Ruminococcus sp.]
MNKFLSFICALALSGNLLTVSGDVNGDSVVDSTDLQLTNDYILGKEKFSESQYRNADINSDGLVDSFDLVMMRKNLAAAEKQIPAGRYIAESDELIRHFNFFENGGNYVYTSTGVSMDFEYETAGNNMIFYIGTRTNVIHAVIEWNDDTHFSLVWEDGTMENFSPCVTEVIDGVTYVDGILIANKSYELPADYNPAGLTADTQTAFSEMSAAALKDGIKLWVYSGFRSYNYQKQIYDNYVAFYGQAAADTFSARAGHSEHQTGLAIDVNCADDSFDGTPEAVWLAENCWKYGFIIRYPKGKQHITGYKYEPWHIRYIGREKAEDVYKSRLTLEEYLGIDSVYK